MESLRKHTDSRLDMERFIKPDTFYWPGCCWSWNDRLVTDDLFSQLAGMNAAGVKNVWILPVPKDFRPHTMPTNLEPEYLSDEYLEIYGDVVEKMRELDMRLFLYDEGGWPSGSVCGRIAKNHPHLASQSLHKQTITLKAGETVEIPRDCLAAFLYEDGLRRRRMEPGETETIRQDGTKVEIYSSRLADAGPASVCPYPDLLNPEVVEIFINSTHEVYKSKLEKYFGNVIPVMFTDEPKASKLPWTYGFAEDFRRKKGYDILDYLPDIFHSDHNHKEGMQACIDYYDWWSERFAEVFFGRIQKWCHEHSLLFSGHLSGDHYTLASREYEYGHILRILRKFDIPGIDTIWKQIFPGERKIVEVVRDNKTTSKYIVSANHHFPKYASSVAHQEGKTWALSESFAVYGSGLSPEQMKWVANFQYVRGINFLMLSGTMLNTKGHYMGQMRPLFCSIDSLYRHIDIFNGYIARLSYLLSLGKPVIDVAVYFPIRDIWAGGSEIEKIAESNDRLAAILLENRCDFDFVDDDVLERESTRVVDGKLEIGDMRYASVFISRTMWMGEGARKKLARLIDGGGRVIYVDSAMGTQEIEGSISIRWDEVKAHINPFILVEPENSMIRVCSRRLTDGILYFVTNEDVRDIECRIRFKESLPMIQLNPETGECYKPTEAEYSEGEWILPVHLEFAGSLVLYFGREDFVPGAAPVKADKKLLTIDKGWLCRKIKFYKIGEENFEILDIRNEEFIPVELGDWREKLGEEFSGDAEYKVEFMCTREEAEKAELLDLGRVNTVCEAVLNGKSLGKRVWQPFAYHVKGCLKEGKNELKVTVTNRMANQYVTTRVFDRWPENVLGPYHKTCLAFEKDFTASGLFGPVNILGRADC